MIHQYKSNGYNIVLDVNSGSVHMVDDIVYDILPYAEELAADNTLSAAALLKEVQEKSSQDKSYNDKSFQASEVKEAAEEIEELYRAGVLFSKDIYESYIQDIGKKESVVKALCLHMAHDCNLACKYCFAHEGEYNGKRALMDFETGKKALDFLVSHSGNRVNLEVDFFGGEPLLSWDVIQRLVEYGRSLEKEHNKRFRFTLTTNGVLLDDDKLTFINKEMDNIVLSLDGRKEVNDAMRPSRGGKGTYDQIVNKFKKAADSRGQEKYYVRGTYTNHNLDFSEDVKHLADLGFRQISIEPVVAPDDAEYALKEKDLPVLYAEYDKLALEMLKRIEENNEFHFFHFNIDLDGGPCVAKRLSGCGSGTEYLAVTPWGDLYPCHQFVGQDEFLLGNVDDGIIREDICKKFAVSNVYSKPKCKDCFAKFYCSGGCAANSWQFHGNINDVYDLGCDLQRKRIECAIMIKCAQA